jgi:hypothetical protein
VTYFEHDACDVTLSVYPHRAGLKNMPGHGGNRTYDLWNTSPMAMLIEIVLLCDVTKLLVTNCMNFHVLDNKQMLLSVINRPLLLHNF